MLEGTMICWLPLGFNGVAVDQATRRPECLYVYEPAAARRRDSVDAGRRRRRRRRADGRIKHFLCESEESERTTEALAKQGRRSRAWQLITQSYRR